MTKNYLLEAKNLLNDWEGNMDKHGYALFSIAYSLIALAQQKDTTIKTDDGIGKKMEKAGSLLIDNIKSLRNTDVELELRCDEQEKWLADLDNRIARQFAFIETLISRVEALEQVKEETLTHDDWSGAQEVSAFRKSE